MPGPGAPAIFREARHAAVECAMQIPLKIAFEGGLAPSEALRQHKSRRGPEADDEQ